MKIKLKKKAVAPTFITDTLNFQTPDWCCKQMISLLHGENIDEVLEPTPGRGNLVKVLQETGYVVTSPLDFDDVVQRQYDAIVMNPPFSPMKKGYEILYACMELSNRIVTLMPWLTLINSERRTDKLVKFGMASVTHLPRSTFPGSRVQACIINLKKGYDGVTAFNFIERPKKT